MCAHPTQPLAETTCTVILHLISDVDYDKYVPSTCTQQQDGPLYAKPKIPWTVNKRGYHERGRVVGKRRERERQGERARDGMPAIVSSGSTGSTLDTPRETNEDGRRLFAYSYFINIILSHTNHDRRLQRRFKHRFRIHTGQQLVSPRSKRLL